jgi:DNA-directed RNA polymerase specialized sigma24 family protein
MGTLQRLPARDRELLTLLMDSPAPRYSDVSARLKMPVGSIGPRRARSLGRLRRELDAAGIDGELVSV